MLRPPSQRLRGPRPAAARSCVRIATTALLLSLGGWPHAAAAQPVAYVGATVHPVSTAAIKHGVVIVEGGTILAVGDATTTIPSDAIRVDLTGSHLYPGFVHPLAQLGLIEIDSVRGTDDTHEIGDNNANVRAEVAVNADSRHLPVAISGGVLTAHVFPGGGLFTGTSAVLRLAGWNWEEMTLAAPTAMHLNFPASAGDGGNSNEDEGEDEADSRELAELDRLLDEVRAYARARDAGERGAGPSVDLDPKLEALRPVLAGELPLFIHADDRDAIASALDWVEKQELTRVVLVASADAAYLATRLAKAKIPVILRSVLALPTRSWEPYDQPFTAAARLHAAGVPVAISGNLSANARNLPFQAAMAAAHGLPRDVALRSVTLTAAEILGVADRVGSLEAGKEATFMVTNGDPLEIRTQIQQVWIAGAEVDLQEDPQRRLYDKYRQRPRPSR